jgi:two-component system, OmpR family, response regulator
VRILLAEDDADMAAMLQRALARTGHVVDLAVSGAQALSMALAVGYDVVLLDVNLPEADGFEVCRRLRANEVWTPVLFLSGRSDVPDRVAGLDAGGDDYLVKPFALEELDARLRAVGRREARSRPAILRAGDLEVDPATHRVRRGSTELALTAKEFALLELLARRVGQVVSRAEIIDALWDFAFDPKSNVVEAVVRRLREKVDMPFDRSTIDTVRGAGYRLRADG